jgi:hypothetical protein
VVYQVVQKHLETWLEMARAGDGGEDLVPAYIEHDFRQYLTCGILANGFARARCDHCGHDFLMAFSCKGRGVCPSCNTRRMDESAAHLVDHVFPQVPVRQWGLSVPKRLRYFLHQDARLVNAVLGIFRAEVEAALRLCSLDAPGEARFGAVSFGHRFGSALNAHLHFHCCVVDGVFSTDEEAIRFHLAFLTDAAIARVQQRTRQRVLKLFERRAVLSPDVVDMMSRWDHRGGFSLNAEVWIPSWDRAGLERLLRYCARPVFASDRLAWIEPDQRLVYHLPKPGPDGKAALTLTPLEFLDRLAALVPPPRKHRHRYHGVLAPHSPLRPAATAYAGLPLDVTLPSVPPLEGSPASEEVAETRRHSPARYLWAAFIARIYQVLPLLCPECGGEMRLIAFITEPVPVQRTLLHIGEPATHPPISPARSPPVTESFDWDQSAVRDPERGELAPEFEFDQMVSW